MTEAEGRRFYAKVRPGVGLGACWWWIACKVWGYGHFSAGGKQQRAHKLAYEQHVGPVPEGLVLDHLCGQRDCVNPAHLEAVTQKVNVRRALWKTHCKCGHELTQDNLYVNPRGHRTCRTCMRAAGRRNDAKRPNRHLRRKIKQAIADGAILAPYILDEVR